MDDGYIKIPIWLPVIFGCVAVGFAIGDFVGYPKTGMVLMPIFYLFVKYRDDKKQQAIKETRENRF